MAREQRVDWRAQLAAAAKQLAEVEQSRRLAMEQQNEARIRKELCNSFIRCGRVVVDADTAKVDYGATREAIRDGGLEGVEDIENLIELSIKRGELVMHEYELYSLLAIIQKPFLDTTGGTLKSNCHLSMDQIMGSILGEYPWIGEDQYQEALKHQLQQLIDHDVLVKPGFYSDSGDGQFSFVKRNMRQLNPMDGGMHNPFLHDPFTGEL